MYQRKNENEMKGRATTNTAPPIIFSTLEIYCSDNPKSKGNLRVKDGSVHRCVADGRHFFDFQPTFSFFFRPGRPVIPPKKWRIEVSIDL
jgi:hypothetical protein